MKEIITCINELCTKTKNIHLNCKQNKILSWKWQNVDLKWRSGTKRHPARNQASCVMNGYSNAKRVCNPHCNIQDTWLSKTKRFNTFARTLKRNKQKKHFKCGKYANWHLIPVTGLLSAGSRWNKDLYLEGQKGIKNWESRISEESRGESYTNEALIKVCFSQGDSFNNCIYASICE